MDKGRIQVAELAGELVGLQTEIAENTLRVLEEDKFGSVTRGVVAEVRGFWRSWRKGWGRNYGDPPPGPLSTPFLMFSAWIEGNS